MPESGKTLQGHGVFDVLNSPNTNVEGLRSLSRMLYYHLTVNSIQTRQG